LTDIKVSPAFRSLLRSDESLRLTPLQKKSFLATMERPERKYPTRAINWECDDDMQEWTSEERVRRYSSRACCSSGRTQIVTRLRPVQLKSMANR
jgi:hypothetical protein